MHDVTLPIGEYVETAVLEALSGRRWRMSPEIAHEISLPAPAVRLMLDRLRRRGILDRNIRGEWQIISAAGAAAGSEPERSPR